MIVVDGTDGHVCIGVTSSVILHCCPPSLFAAHVATSDEQSEKNQVAAASGRHRVAPRASVKAPSSVGGEPTMSGSSRKTSLWDRPGRGSMAQTKTIRAHGAKEGDQRDGEPAEGVADQHQIVRRITEGLSSGGGVFTPAGIGILRWQVNCEDTVPPLLQFLFQFFPAPRPVISAVHEPERRHRPLPPSRPAVNGGRERASMANSEGSLGHDCQLHHAVQTPAP